MPRRLFGDKLYYLNKCWLFVKRMMMSSNENIFRVLALCEGNSPVTGEFPPQRAVTQSFDVFFICAWTNGWVNSHYNGTPRKNFSESWTKIQLSYKKMNLEMSSVKWQPFYLGLSGLRRVLNRLSITGYLDSDVSFPCIQRYANYMQMYTKIEHESNICDHRLRHLMRSKGSRVTWHWSRVQNDWAVTAPIWKFLHWYFFICFRQKKKKSTIKHLI